MMKWVENIYICRSAFQFMASEAGANNGRETGGILIGYKNGQDLVIVHATGPGPKAVKKRYLLILDTEHIGRELKHFEINFNFGYEGSWHKHETFGDLAPSFIDKLLMRRVVKSANYDVDQALLILTNKYPVRVEDISCFLFKKGCRRYMRKIPIICRDIDYEDRG